MLSVAVAPRFSSKARLRLAPLTVVKLPVATNRVPSGETAMYWILVSLAGSTTPVTVMLMAPVSAPVVGSSAISIFGKFPAAMTAPLASLISPTVRIPVGAKVGSIRLLTRSYFMIPRRTMPLTCEKAPAMKSALPSAVAWMAPTIPSNCRLSGEMTPVWASKATKFCLAYVVVPVGSCTCANRPPA